MAETIYLPKKPNSRYTYLKLSIFAIVLLFTFHYLHLLFSYDKSRKHFLNPGTLEIIFGIMFIAYYCSKRMVTEVKINDESKNLTISYVIILKNENKIDIPFENINFELNRIRSKSHLSTLGCYIFIWKKI